MFAASPIYSDTIIYLWDVPISDGCQSCENAFEMINSEWKNLRLYQ